MRERYLEKPFKIDLRSENRISKEPAREFVAGLFGRLRIDLCGKRSGHLPLPSSISTISATESLALGWSRFITESERNSGLDMYEQADLVELWAIHYAIIHFSRIQPIIWPSKWLADESKDIFLDFIIMIIVNVWIGGWLETKAHCLSLPVCPWKYLRVIGILPLPAFTGEVQVGRRILEVHSQQLLSWFMKSRKIPITYDHRFTIISNRSEKKTT